MAGAVVERRADPGAERRVPGSAEPEDHPDRPPRVLVVWVPDWPVVAAAVEETLPAHLPIAVVAQGEVQACSAPARSEGVRRGMRRRDAAATCPDLVVVEANEERDRRCFEPVLAAIEAVSAAVSPIRPGLCALAVPSRYYGGEQEAAAVIAEQLVSAADIWDCRIGIADGIFTAEQAARRAAPQDSVVVPPGKSAAFLSELPVSVLDDFDLVSLLRRLGIPTLGDFAALPAGDVQSRFGRQGGWLHSLVRGRDARTAAPRLPPLELDARADFLPPLELIEPIVFSTRQAAERCVASLAKHGLVCTGVQIEVFGDNGWLGSRSWAHSRWFTAADLVDRVYWQLQADPAPEPVSGVRLVPHGVESLGDHGEGLWGSAPNERIERGVARLQGMLGPEAVLAPALQGGRSPRDRQSLTPWGERQVTPRPAGLPWPGSIPPPAPSRVFPVPRRCRVVDADARTVGITERGSITAEPASFQPEPAASLTRVEAWAGPWPVDESWWDGGSARRARFQVVGVDGSAWLLLVEDGEWWAEARYD